MCKVWSLVRIENVSQRTSLFRLQLQACVKARLATSDVNRGEQPTYQLLLSPFSSSQFLKRVTVRNESSANPRAGPRLLHLPLLGLQGKGHETYWKGRLRFWS